MALNFLLKRSGTASKRPNPASMALGELDLNYDASTGGIYYKDSAGNVVKVGPCQVSATAPNVSPAGTAGNSAGEFWFDTVNQVLKVWSGSAWLDATSTSDLLPLAGGTMTGDITFAGTQSFPVSGIQSASTTQPGVVQLNDTTSSTSTTEALTANQGKELQDQINALSIASNITLAGTIDATTGNLVTVTAEGTAAGFTVGDPLPTAASGNDNYFVIVTTPGTMTPPGGSSQECHQGDWWLSDGTAWVFLDVGFNATAATTTTPGVVQLATDAEVQAGLNTDHAVTPSGLQSKVSDSTSTTSSTTLASSTAVKDAYDAGIQGQTDAAAAQATADAAIPDASFTSLGDILSGTGAGTYAALALGTDSDVLTADSTCPGGVKWAAPSGGIPASVFTVKGGIIAGTGPDTYTEVSPGLPNQVLSYGPTKGSCDIFWTDLPGEATPLNPGLVYGCSIGSSTSLGQNALQQVAIGQNNTALGAQALGFMNEGADNVAIGWCAGSDLTCGSGNVLIGCGAQTPLLDTNCRLAIGFATGQYWLTGDSTKAIKPGAGIIDCTGSCGTAGQVLMSDGANAICWGTAGGGGGSGTVTDITAGSGLTGGTITTSGTIAINSACVLEPADFTAKGQILVGTGSGTYCALPAGSSGQILYANSFFPSGVVWCAAPSASTTETLGLTYGLVEGPAPFPSTSCENASFGYFSMGCNLAGGAFNVAVGNSSAYWMCTGSNNTAVGYAALFSTSGAVESNNTAIGFGAMSNAGGSRNVAVGENAGYCMGCNNIGGDDNITIGFNAACLLESGSRNVVIGSGVQPASITGSCQLAIGFAAGQCWLSGTSTKAIRPGAGIVDCAGSCGTAGQVLMSNGSNAVCWGALSAATPTTLGALYGLVSGTANTGVGQNALLVNTGTFNTAVGVQAMWCNTTGTRNTAIGMGALQGNVAGGFNTALGQAALLGGDNNCTTAVGWGALRGILTSTTCSVAIGVCAGAIQQSGDKNVFIGPCTVAPSSTAGCQLVIGYDWNQCWLTGDSTRAIRPGAGIVDCAGSCGTAGQVLMSNGANAICWGAAGGASPATPTVAGTLPGRSAATISSVGCNAMRSLTTGLCNTAAGVNALCSLTNGCFNTAVGFNASCSVNTGISNTSVGHSAGMNTTTGNSNTAIGVNAMFGISTVVTGSHNTALGGSAMFGVTSGSGNIAIGGANAAGTFAPVFGVTTECNRIAMGSTAVTNAYVQVAWTVVSDARDKIVEGGVPHGLGFVNQLEPKAFHFKEDRESTTPHGPLRYGFLAQDILALEGGNGIIIDAEDPDKLRYNGEALIPVLVNAIKELSAKNDELEARLRALEIPG